MRIQALCEEVEPGYSRGVVLGAGQSSFPRCALLFINPTARNSSLAPGWPGPPLPFVGFSGFFRFLQRSGLVRFRARIPVRSSDWVMETCLELFSDIEAADLYVTNAVKWVSQNSETPSLQMAQQFSQELSRELDEVRPELILAMGALPYRMVTGNAIRLRSFWDAQGAFPKEGALREGVPVYPCYFPFGRGNASAALRVVSRLQRAGLV